LSRVLMKEKASKKAERDLIEEATSTMSKWTLMMLILMVKKNKNNEHLSNCSKGHGKFEFSWCNELCLIELFHVPSTRTIISSWHAKSTRRAFLMFLLKLFLQNVMINNFKYVLTNYFKFQWLNQVKI
jgi:hypothetical protein